jgi:uncharacterized protein (TIGR02598 family)
MWLRREDGFSMVEVALALGVVAFAFLSLLALLPLGVKSNQISAEETRAVGLISMVEADLRYTHPTLNGGLSEVYGLPLPYALDTGTGELVFSTAEITEGTLYKILMDAAEMPVTANGAQPARYQVSVIYTRVPAPGDLEPIEARLVINWPAINTTTVADLTDPAGISDYVEGIVTFPAP